jgi:hypothetical protein
MVAPSIFSAASATLWRAESYMAIAAVPSGTIGGAAASWLSLTPISRAYVYPSVLMDTCGSGMSGRYSKRLRSKYWTRVPSSTNSSEIG